MRRSYECVILIISVLCTCVSLQHLDSHLDIYHGENVDWLLDQTKAIYKEKFFEIQKRHRRQANNAKQSLYREQSDLWILKGFENFKGCPGVLQKLELFEVGGNFYAAVAHDSVVNNTRIYKFSVDEGCQELLVTLPTKEAFDFVVIPLNEPKAVNVIAIERDSKQDNHTHPGSQVYVLKFISDKEVGSRKGEILLSSHPSCITTWIQYEVPHVAICNSKTLNTKGIINTTESYHGHSYIFRASGGYFDHTNSIPTHNPKKIINFKIVSKYYLAVANHPNIAEGRDVATTIFQYDLNEEAYKHLQDLPSKGAVDVCFFTMGSEPQTEHFLVIANQFTFDSSGNIDYNVNSFIYKFAGEKFEPFQVISTTNVTSCLAYQTENGQLALIFSEATGATVYQYDGWIFVSDAQYTQYTQQAMGIGIVSFTTAVLDRNLYIMVANNNSELSDSDNMFLPTFEHFPSTVLNNAYSVCSEYQSSLEKDPVPIIRELGNHTLKVDDNNIEFGDVIANSVTAKQVNTDKLLSSDGRVLDVPTVSALQDLSIKVLDLADKLSSLDYKQMEAIRTIGDYTIQGEVTIGSITSNCGEGCFLAEASSSNLNGITVSDLHSNVIYLSDSNVQATLHFASLVVERNIDTSILNDTNVDEYFQFDQDIDFSGTTKFNGNIVFQDSLRVEGQINDKTISTNLLLKTGDQQLDWELKVEDVVFNTLKVTVVNDVPIHDYYLNAITTASNFTLIKPKFLRGLNADNLVHQGLLNGVDVADMYENAMKLEGDQIITGSHTYNTIEMGSLILEGQLNGHSIPDDFILINDENVENVLSGTLHLLENTTFESISVIEKVGDITVTNGQLDLLTKTANNVQVTGMKTFLSGMSLNDVNSNTVNSFPSNHFEMESSIYGNPEGTLVYENLQISNNLKIAGLLTVGDLFGIDLMRVKDNAIEVTNEDFPLSVTFENSVKVLDDLKPQVINQVRGDDFVSKINSSVEIQGEKHFTADVIVEQPVAIGTTVNDNDLSAVWDDVLKIHGDQFIDDSFTIDLDVVVVTKIQSMKTKVGNREFDNFVSLNDIGVLSGVKRFGNLSIKGNWTVGSLTVDGLFDSVDISIWESDTLFRDVDNQQVTSKKTVANFIINDAQIESLSNVDFNALTSVVRSDVPGTVNSDLTFVGFFQVNDAYLGNIDGVDSNAPLSWLLYEVDQNLSAGVVVLGTADINSLYDVSSLINDVNVMDLLGQTIRIDQNISLPYLQFENLVANNLNVGRIQDILVPEDLILKSSNSPQTIEGVKAFNNKVVVGDSFVNPLLNESVSSSTCLPSTASGPEDWVVQGNIVIQEGTAVNITYINNDLLVELSKRIWPKDVNIILEYAQTFSDVVFNGDLNSNEIVNGIDLSQVSQQFVSISSTEEQEITGSHIYDTVIAQSTIETVQLESNSINGITFNQLTESVLLRSVEQDLYNKFVFQDVEADNIIIEGTINGVDIVQDLVYHNKSQVITGRKTINSLDVEGSVTLCDVCSVDSLKLSEWAPKIVQRSGNFTVSSKVEFSGMVLEKPAYLSGQLNGVSVNKNLLIRQEEQEIMGKMTFSSKLPTNVLDATMYETVTQDFKLAASIQKLQVKGSYGDIDINRLFHKSVRKDADVVLKEAATLSRLSSDTIFDDSINSTINDLLGLGWATPITSLPDALLSQLEKYAQNIDRVAEKQAIELLYFEESSLETTFFGEIDAIYSLKSADGHVIFCVFSVGTKQLYCNSSSSPLLSSVDVVSVVSSKEENGHFAVCLGSSAEEQSSSIIYSWDSPEPVELQHLTFNNLVDCASLAVNDQSCFLFVENGSSLFCHSTGAPEPYILSQQLPDMDANKVAVCNQQSGNPLVVILSGAKRSSSRITTWKVDSDGQLKLQGTRVTSPATSIDCMCNGHMCYLVTLSPPKPLAISGDVTVWRITEGNMATTLQRIPVSEPIEAKFALLPNGRLCLFVLQCGGTNAVLVYTEQGMSQFSYTTVVHTTAARDLHLVVNNRQLLLAVAMKNNMQYGSHSLQLYQAKFLGL